ncbi:MAG: flagellar filament capping protein FliD [bacterium]
MSTLSIEGLASGFNTTEIIEAMLDAQIRGPIGQIESRIETYNEKLTALQTLSANLLSVRISAQTLSDKTLFNAKQATSSNTSLVSVTNTNSAKTGGFSIQVNNLAKADQISSDFFSTATESLDLTGEFVLNGRTIQVSTSDSLQTIASQINTSNAGVQASTIETAPGQVKLVLTASSTGVGKIELRDVGSGSLLEDLTLVDNNASTSYDYTVNASANGAISKAYTNLTDVAGVSGNFVIRDAGGQYSVTVDGANSISATDTVQDIIDKINAAAAGTNISAVAVQDASNDWHIEIRSTTGIPTQFDDSDNVLQGLGIVDGIQSEDFSDTITAIGTLMDLTSPPSGTFRITGGDAIAVDVAVDLSDDSLQDIVDKINAAAGLAGSDVTAEIMTVGSENRISIKSASGNPTFDPSIDTENILKTLGVVDVAFKNADQAGENAQFTYNGVTVNRASNLVNDLVEGVSIALISESATERANISITENLSGLASVVQDFVTAYNSARSQINEYTFFDSTTGQTGVLLGDGTVRTVETMMADLVSRRVPKMPGALLNEMNDGQGVKLGKIKITDRAGTSAEIDLSTARTVDDVLFLISNYPTVGVRAEINSSGTGINIVDESDGVISPLKVEEVGNGTTAQDLGIRNHIYSNKLTGTRIYEGGSNSPNEFGLQLTAAGTLAFDSAVFQDALNNRADEVRNLFTAERVGIGDEFVKKMDFLTAPSVGLIAVRSDGISTTIKRFQESIKRFEERSKKMEETLRKRFTALEVTLAQSQQLSNYLATQSGLQSSNN